MNRLLHLHQFGLWLNTLPIKQPINAVTYKKFALLDVTFTVLLAAALPDHGQPFAQLRRQRAVIIRICPETLVVRIYLRFDNIHCRSADPHLSICRGV